MKEFTYAGEHITLGQLLKVLDVVGSGGEVKLLLSSGGVTVNEEPEDRRGRKLREGDVVRLPGGRAVRLKSPTA